ncbi:MAG: ABC transporter ATP-binding protein [Cyanobacteria bacterium NC_groundwater_1444_Ag_S-0.65um_54_12]|nr:ABC transporter ATP-binding protein [Cyanobacteria bacterium NC_groundwater_1444_Ag_S-0.65um_54_12]
MFKHSQSGEEEAIGKVYDPQIMRRLLSYAKHHGALLGFCIILLLGISLLQLAQPYLVKLAIDHELAPSAPTGAVGLPGGLWSLAIAYFAILLLNGTLQYSQALLIQETGQRIIQRIRQEVFDYLLTLDLAYFDRNPVGRLVTRVANDTETLNEMYTSVLVNLFRDLFVIAGTMIIMLRLDWQLALVGLIVFPFITLATLIFQRLVRAAWRRVRVKLAQINATLAENLSGMRIIQVFTREAAQAAEFRAISNDYYEASWSQLRVAALLRPVIDFLATLALVGLLWYGGLRSLHGTLELGTLYAFTAYLRQLYNPISEVAEKLNILQAAMASAERIFLLLDTRPQVSDPLWPVLPTSPLAASEAARHGIIEFKDVWFAYQDERWVLRAISFAVAAGETVAFVGHTGAGKSSLMNLIARFYDVQRGQVLLDGHDVREWRQADLRHELGIVLQDPFLFTGTVGENICLDRTELTETETGRFLQSAGGAALLSTLPEGLATRLAERGMGLSTGERQIIALARALAAKPAILILDEATANVDSHTEALIQRALSERSGTLTTLIVAHRLATVQHADRIIVLHKGRIREAGTHAELLATDGLYRKLWLLQSDRSNYLARNP